MGLPGEGGRTTMYRVFVLQRPGGQRFIDCSMNVLSKMKAMNRQLERKGKKKRDWWRLIWFGEHLPLNDAKKLATKMQRSAGNPSVLRKLMDEHAETGPSELHAQEMPEH